VSGMSWALLALFLALLVGGAGVVIWTAAQARDGAARRPGVLAVSASVALAGLVGAVVVGASLPGSGGVGHMMGGGMGDMMGGSSSSSCPWQPETESAAVIQGFRFCPTTLRVQTGTTITWTNDDNVPHTVTSRTGPHFDSGSLAQGRSWSHRFDRAGTFSYYCAIHPRMRATVEVR